MYIGKQKESKKNLILYILTKLLIDRKLDSKKIKEEYNLSSKTIYRYISEIKNMLCDFEIYYIEIYYDMDKKLYICKINK